MSGWLMNPKLIPAHFGRGTEPDELRPRPPDRLPEQSGPVPGFRRLADLTLRRKQGTRADRWTGSAAAW